MTKKYHRDKFNHHVWAFMSHHQLLDGVSIVTFSINGNDTKEKREIKNPKE